MLKIEISFLLIYSWVIEWSIWVFNGGAGKDKLHYRWVLLIKFNFNLLIKNSALPIKVHDFL